MNEPDFDQCLRLLRATPNTISALCAGITDKQAQTRFTDGEWSMVETLRHMIDIEREDMREHFQAAISGRAWKSIDPPSWVIGRAYNNTQIDEAIVSFIEERGESLSFLRSLRDQAVAWDRMIETGFGGISAGEVFGSWVEHDNLHLRQLIELRHHITLGAVGGFDTGYAGGW